MLINTVYGFLPAVTWIFESSLLLGHSLHVNVCLLGRAEMPNVACGHWQRSSAASLPCASASTLQSYYKAALQSLEDWHVQLLLGQPLADHFLLYAFFCTCRYRQVNLWHTSCNSMYVTCSCLVFWWIIPLLALTETFLFCKCKNRTTQHLLSLSYKAVKPRALGTLQDWTCV